VVDRGTYCVVAVAVVAGSIGLTTTIDLGLAPSWWDEQRIVLLAVLLLATAGGLAFNTTGRSMATPAALALLLLLALGLCSSFQAPRTFVALVDVATYAVLASFLLTFIGVPGRYLAFASVLFTLAIAAPYVMGVVARYVSALLVSMPIGADTLLVGFANPRFPAHLQALTIPFLPVALSFFRHSILKVVVVVIGTLWWMCLTGSGSRTAWIALGAAMVVLVLVEGTRGESIRVHVRLCVAGAALYLFAFRGVPYVFNLESTVEAGRLSEFGSLSLRVELWLLSARAIVADPLLGLGPMHFAYMRNGIAAHPHNFWLQIAAEWGPVAGAVVAAASTMLWIRAVRLARLHSLNHSQDHRGGVQAALPAGIAAALTAWLVAIQTDGLMVVPTSLAASAIVLGLACGFVTQGSVASLRPTSWRALHTVVLAGAAAVLAFLPLDSFSDVKAREDFWLTANHGERMSPRFWQQGWIGPDEDPGAHERAVP
jgi:O-antigen ligase